MRHIMKEIKNYKYNRHDNTYDAIVINKYLNMFLKYGKSSMTINHIIDSVLRREIQ